MARCCQYSEKVSEVAPVPGDEQVVYGRSANAVWVSRDAGATWAHTGQLPSRPMSLAVTSKDTRRDLRGHGIRRPRSDGRNGGETWQVVNDPTISMSGAAPVP